MECKQVLLLVTTRGWEHESLAALEEREGVLFCFCGE